MPIHGLTAHELKRRYQANQEEIRKLEAERRAYLARGMPSPYRLRWRLRAARAEAEELRRWGHLELTAWIREVQQDFPNLARFE